MPALPLAVPAAATRDAFLLSDNTPTAGVGSNAYQQVTVSFTRPAYGVRFNLDDLDRSGSLLSGYVDHVHLSTTVPFTSTVGSRVHQVRVRAVTMRAC